MNCDDFQAAYLSGQEGEGGSSHLAGCSTCQEDLPALEAARRLFADSPLWEDPDPRLEAQVVALISSPESPPERRTVRRLAWRAPLIAAGSAAFALALSLAVWSLVRAPGADWMVPIAGTPDAPTAAGVVEGWNQDSGTRVVFSVDGLAPAPAGSLYEFWFSNENVHVSAGTFTGSGEVELWVGVSRGAYPRLWVTLEAIDEDESPSGVTVLDTNG